MNSTLQKLKFGIAALCAIPDVLKSLLSENYAWGVPTNDAHVLIVRSNIEDFTNNTLVLGRSGDKIAAKYVDMANQHATAIFTTRGSTGPSVAEMTLKILLDLAKNSIVMDDFARKMPSQHMVEHEKQSGAFTGIELSSGDKVLCILGYGVIGAKFASFCKPFDMRIIVWDDQEAARQRAINDGCEVMRPEVMAPLADIFTVHTQGPKTCVPQELIELFKPTVICLNTAYENAYDLQALYLKMVDTNILFGSDFSEPGTNKIKSDFRTRTYITMHGGADTHEAQERSLKVVMQKIDLFLTTGTTTGSLNFPHIQVSQPDIAESRITVVAKPAARTYIVDDVCKILGVDAPCVEVHKAENEQFVYVTIDANKQIDPSLLEEINKINGVLRTRII